MIPMQEKKELIKCENVYHEWKKKRCPILVSVSNYIYKSDFLESTLKWLFNVSNSFCENGCYNFLSSFSVTNVAYEKMNQYTVL